MIESILGRLAAGENLTQSEMAETIDRVMQGACQENEIALLLTSLRAKGETVAEIAGAAEAMRRHMTPIRSNRQGLVDTCGTGGDGSQTFNISTAAALVASAAGVPVAKHGNRRVSSKTGSADVLAALGVNVEASVAQVERCLDELGICFCFAPQLHPAMRQVAAVRKKLGVPTIFNLLGPLTNPAGAPYQVLGVGRSEIRPLLAAALHQLGTEHAVVVCGSDGLDEVTLTGETLVSEVDRDGVRQVIWTPEVFGLQAGGLESMVVDGPESSAAMIRQILDGQSGPPREIVVLNAAAAIYAAGRSDKLTSCAALATEAIDSGAASRRLAELARLSHEPLGK